MVQWLRIYLPVQGVGSIPVQGTKIPHVSGQLSPHTATREAPMHCNKDPEQPKLFLKKVRTRGSGKVRARLNWRQASRGDKAGLQWSFRPR